MEIKLETKPLQTLYKNLGLEDKGRVQQFLGKTAADNLKKYVSFKSGVQEKSTGSINHGEEIIINVPYAHFQAEGKAMIGTKSHSPWAKLGEKKIYTGRALTYHSTALRGSHPFERMKADKGQSILNQTANYARRLANG
ncbi:MAG: hypothetical protein J6K45_06515 [Clostridia bacterium]|nr:hypothetical protein [Clostridia bacterium]